MMITMAMADDGDDGEGSDFSRRGLMDSWRKMMRREMVMTMTMTIPMACADGD